MLKNILLPPANEIWGWLCFTPVCQSVHDVTSCLWSHALSRGGLCQESPRPIRWTSDVYASYWNAFFCYFFFISSLVFDAIREAIVNDLVEYDLNGSDYVSCIVSEEYKDTAKYFIFIDIFILFWIPLIIIVSNYARVREYGLYPLFARIHSVH